MRSDPRDSSSVIGRPSGSGIIVSTTGRKWGLVQLPDGARVELATEAGVEAFVQLILERTMEADFDGRRNPADHG